MNTSNDLYELPTSEGLPTATASELKNEFKVVFSKTHSGPVSITRNRKREAILISAELYDMMIVELLSKDPLNLLRQDYEKRFERMQTNAAHDAYEEAFDASEDDLGNAALSQASKNK